MDRIVSPPGSCSPSVNCCGSWVFGFVNTASLPSGVIAISPEPACAGGLFTGAEGIKTVEQAALFGGRAGIGYDFCYHASCDDLSNVDLRTLEEMTGAASAVVLRFANSTQDLETEGRRLLGIVAPVPPAAVDQGRGPSNAAAQRQAQ